MKPTLKYIFISFFALLVIGYFVFILGLFSGRSKDEVCKELVIEFLDSTRVTLITESDIAILLDRNDLNPIGKTIKHIRTESIEDILRKNELIKSVECYNTPSGIVHIRIMQRHPKFRVVGFGSYYIDTDRKRMPVSENFGAYVPVVSGRVTVSFATGQMFDFVTYLEDNPFWNAQIEQIYVRDDKKIELVPRVGDAIIILGTLDNYAAKLEKLHKLYTKGFNIIGWNRYKSIDLQYKGQVVCDKAIFDEDEPVLKTEEKKDTIIVHKI